MTRDITPAADALASSGTGWRIGAIGLGHRLPPLGAGAAFSCSTGSLMMPGFLLLLASATIAACLWRGLSVPVDDVGTTAALVTVLLAAAVYYRARGEHTFVLCLTSLAQIVSFAACYIVLMYALATLNEPLADANLAAFDEWCGITAPSLRQWAGSHPIVATLLAIAYDTLLFQTALVVAVLGLRGDGRRLTGFVRAFMIAACIALGLYVALPAVGPFATYGFPTSPDQAIFLEHFESLRGGTRTVASLRGSEGLITFPSFHVAWAVLLTWAFRGRWLLFAGIFLLNSLVIVSTMTTGWHYFADVLAGATVAFLSIAVDALRRTEFIPFRAHTTE